MRSPSRGPSKQFPVVGCGFSGPLETEFRGACGWVPIGEYSVQRVGEARRRQWREDGVWRRKREKRQRDERGLTVRYTRRANRGVERRPGRRDGDDRLDRNGCLSRSVVVRRAALVRPAGDRQRGRGATNARRKLSTHRSGGGRQIQYRSE